MMMPIGGHNTHSRNTTSMGPLQGFLIEVKKSEVEENDLSKYESFNADVGDDRIESDTIGYQQIACQHDGPSSTIVGLEELPSRMIIQSTSSRSQNQRL